MNQHQVAGNRVTQLNQSAAPLILGLVATRTTSSGMVRSMGGKSGEMAKLLARYCSPSDRTGTSAVELQMRQVCRVFSMAF